MKKKSFKNNGSDPFEGELFAQGNPAQESAEEAYLTRALSTPPDSFLSPGFPDRVVSRVEKTEIIRDRFRRMGLVVLILILFCSLVFAGSLVLEVSILKRLTGLFVRYLPYGVSFILLTVVVQTADTLLLARDGD